MTDADAAKVETALDALLADHDPKAEGYEEFRGHQFDAGLAWVQYPEGNGGLGVAPQLQRNVNRRLAEAGAPPMDLSMFFIALAGPTIVTHGDEAVKQRFLRPMFTGEEKWCQLFSEPGAGSDFAGLGCKAVKDGDEWVINGQKVWNTLAHIADWGMLVARTDPSVRKHRGMTYFALDMHAPGVDVQPLRQITGEAEFNEVFMTDAIIPDAHRIGAEGEGWRAALTTPDERAHRHRRQRWRWQRPKGWHRADRRADHRLLRPCRHAVGGRPRRGDAAVRPGRRVAPDQLPCLTGRQGGQPRTRRFGR
nr:acyl-CoA dehydrogenase family protein [Candidatus Microthrix sp.]